MIGKTAGRGHAECHELVAVNWLSLFAGLAQNGRGLDVGGREFDSIEQPLRGGFIELGSFIGLEICGDAADVRFGGGGHELLWQATCSDEDRNPGVLQASGKRAS